MVKYDFGEQMNMTTKNRYILKGNSEINIEQSTQDGGNITIQTIITPLKEGSQIIQFN